VVYQVQKAKSILQSLYGAFAAGLLLTCAVGPTAFAHAHEMESSFTPQSAPRPLKLDEESVRAAGIKLAVVATGELSPVLKASGEAQADQTKAFKVNPPVSGVVQSVLVKQGDQVQKGQTLAVVVSSEAASLLSRLLGERAKLNADIARATTQIGSDIKLADNDMQLAEANLQRQQELFKEGIAAQKDYSLATSAATSNRVKLATLKQRLSQEVALLNREMGVTTDNYREQLMVMGLPSYTIDSAIKTGQVKASLPILAPVSGTVTARDITLGERVDTTKEVFAIVNLDPIWVMVDVYQEQISYVKMGQSVSIVTPSGDKVTGRISSLGSVVDPNTRTIHVRIIVDNKGGIVKPGMFVQAEIAMPAASAHNHFAQGSPASSHLSSSESEHDDFVVPDAAIQRDGNASYVYLSRDGSYIPQSVKVVASFNGQTQIEGPLNPGDLIVASGAAQLKNQTAINESFDEHQGENHEDHKKHSEETPESENARLLTAFLGGMALVVVVLGVVALWRRRLTAKV
jgi:cobalt-zinc-cadmium efflux system membrane fusion protein